MQPQKSHKLISRSLKYHQVMIPAALIFAAITGGSKVAQALSIEFIFSENTPVEVKAAFPEAGKAWEQQLTDDVVVNIFVESGELPPNVLAGTRPAMTRVQYSEFISQLCRDRSLQDGLKYVGSSDDDAGALNSLPGGNNYKYLRATYNSSNNSWGGSSEVVKGTDIWLTRANAKALNFIERNSDSNNELDASIRISNTIAWNYEPQTTSKTNQYDLLTVATHEIGHVLGFVSGIDAFQLLATDGTLNSQNSNYFTPMNLFRFSKKSTDLGIPDWTSDETFFALERGKKSLTDLSRGTKIDGFQVGHWKNGSAQGIMNPFLKTGERWVISDTDRLLLDAIGWDYAPQLSKNVAQVMLGINWNTSNPDLSLLENVFKAYLSVEFDKLKQERDTIKDWILKTWSKLDVAANQEFVKQQQKIQDTLNKIRDNKYNPDKRMEEALKGAADILKSVVDLTKTFEKELKAPLTAQITDALNGSSKELTGQLKKATRWQLMAMASQVSNASESQRNEWRKDIRKSLRLLYQEKYNNQSPSEAELNLELAKLLDNSAPDGGLGSGSKWRFWQTGGTKKPNFDKTGEFTFHSMAAPETFSSTEPDYQKMEILGLLGLLSVSFFLKQRSKKGSNSNI